MCQGWTVLLMDVQGCHLWIASVKMIDWSPQRGRFKFTAPQLNFCFGFPQVERFCWWQFCWCLLQSCWRMGRRPLGTEDRADSNGLNQCFSGTSARSCLWVFVKEGRERERGRESMREAHYHWITKQTLTCQLWSVTQSCEHIYTQMLRQFAHIDMHQIHLLYLALR